MLAVVLSLDTSEFMRNGDFTPTRLDAQTDAGAHAMPAFIPSLTNSSAPRLLLEAATKPRKHCWSLVLRRRRVCFSLLWSYRSAN